MNRCAKVTDDGVKRECAYASVPVACSIRGAAYVVCKNPCSEHCGQSMKSLTHCPDFRELVEIEDGPYLGFDEVLRKTVQEPTSKERALHVFEFIKEVKQS